MASAIPRIGKRVRVVIIIRRTQMAYSTMKIKLNKIVEFRGIRRDRKVKTFTVKIQRKKQRIIIMKKEINNIRWETAIINILKVVSWIKAMNSRSSNIWMMTMIISGIILRITKDSAIIISCNSANYRSKVGMTPAIANSFKSTGILVSCYWMRWLRGRLKVTSLPSIFTKKIKL